MFRQWLESQVCRHFGHHWWVKSGVDVDQSEDGEQLNVFVVVRYGNCKRCDTPCLEQKPDRVRTHIIQRAEVESMEYKDEQFSFVINQKIQVL